MNPEDPRRVEQLYVFKNRLLVGVLVRTETGSFFEYDREFLQSLPAVGLSDGICYAMPPDRPRYETHGVNLAPYFANLLPEGLRLHALKSFIKTSEDDLFSLLAALGSDVVGDVFVRTSPDQSIKLKPKPEVPDLDQASFNELLTRSLSSQQLAESGLEPAVPGIQDKISDRIISFPVRVKNRRRAYLLKLNPPKFPHLVENEHFFMQMAADLGLAAAKTRLVHDRDGCAGLLVERFDRSYDKLEKRLVSRHQEDACQLLAKYPADKYRLSHRAIAESVAEHCTSPIVESARLIKLIAFSYLIGNGDLHAKNISVGEYSGAGLVALSPAYDLLSTVPYGDKHMALQFEDRTDNILRSHFVAFGARLGVRAEAVESILGALQTRSTAWIARLPEIGLPATATKNLMAVMQKRRNDL